MPQIHAATKRIGIFAGTFDPIHEGHIAFAYAALEAGLEKVMFLPEPRPRRKQGVRALEHRAAMVQLAVAHEPRYGTIVLEQARFTPLETLPILQNRFAGFELALLFGDDVIGRMVDHIADWPHIEDLAKSVSLVIASRSESQAVLAEKLHKLKASHNLPFRYMFVEPQQQTISSSSVRKAIKDKHNFTHVPKAVADYIEQNGLYEADDITS